MEPLNCEKEKKRSEKMEEIEKAVEIYLSFLTTTIDNQIRAGNKNPVICGCDCVCVCGLLP